MHAWLWSQRHNSQTSSEKKNLINLDIIQIHDPFHKSGVSKIPGVVSYLLCLDSLWILFRSSVTSLRLVFSLLISSARKDRLSFISSLSSISLLLVWRSSVMLALMEESSSAAPLNELWSVILKWHKMF